MLVYVGSVIHLAKDAQVDMMKLNQIYQLKEDFGPQNIYIGANAYKGQLKDGRAIWYTTCVEYLCGSTKNVDLIL